MPKEFQFDAFLSHSSKDDGVVEELAARLREDGLRIWLDLWNLPVGTHIGAGIERGLEASRALVLMMSQHAFDREWITLEKSMFLFRDPLNLGRRFLPVRLDNAELNEPLSGYKYVDWRDRSEHQYQLLRAALIGLREGDKLLTDKSSAPLVQCVIDLLINCPSEVFAQKHAANLRQALHNLVGYNKELDVIPVQQGAVRARLKIAPEQARTVMDAVNRGHFGRFDVLSAFPANPSTPMNTSPPPRIVVSGPEPAPGGTSVTRGEPPLKAVVFTHFGTLPAKLDKDQEKATDYFKKILKAHLGCSQQVGLVYVYIDLAVRDWLSGEVARHTGVSAESLIKEGQLKGFLERVEHEAREELGMENHDRPKIQYVGLKDLLAYLHTLRQVSPELRAFTVGPSGEFTYDSPKFVEAIIRLARGCAPHLARYPIIRIDEDALPSPKAIEHLVHHYMKTSRNEAVFFFSGTYGIAQGDYCAINDHAVRTHWFFPPRGLKRDEDCQRFLGDLARLGARQLPPEKEMFSKEMQRLSESKKLYSRSVPQAISGAGLTTSRIAISLLPPFMNFGSLTTWVDDYVKRLLHEAIGDIKEGTNDSVPAAKIQQDRHPDGIQDKHVAEASNYFERLARGCIFTRLIHDEEGKATDYAKMVKRIVGYQFDGVQSDSKKQEERNGLRSGMYTTAESHLNLVRRCWGSEEFAGTRSYDWAHHMDSQNANTLCGKMVDDAMRYLGLLERWPIFVRTVERLPYLGSAWLFERVA